MSNQAGGLETEIWWQRLPTASNRAVKFPTIGSASAQPGISDSPPGVPSISRKVGRQRATLTEATPPKDRRKTSGDFCGDAISQGRVNKLLGNILYTGQVKAGNEVFPGEHESIIDQRTFELIQTKLKENTWKPGNPHRVKMDALLRG